MYFSSPFDLAVLPHNNICPSFFFPWDNEIHFCLSFSMKELEKDMAMLRNGMKEVGREVEFYRTQPPVNGDRYVNLH